MLKADAYGVGAAAFARELSRGGVSIFGVGDSSEALELLESGCKSRLLILGAVVENEIPAVVSHGVEVCLHSEERLRAIVAEARRQGRRCRVHLKVDTGMGRLGVLPSRALELARKIESSPALEFAGLCTHLAGVDSDAHDENREQLRRFRAIVRRVRDDSAAKPVVHAVASPSLELAEDAAVEGLGSMARVGIALHGLRPRGAGPAYDALAPVLALRTQVVYLKDVPAGSTLGYRRTHRVDGRTRIATLPMGYNDGLSASLGGAGRVLVRGQWAPIVGAVSMDYTTVDVGHIPGVRVGDTVTLVGRDGNREQGLVELAERAQRSPYEFSCAIGKRVIRVYHESPRVRTAER